MSHWGKMSAARFALARGGGARVEGKKGGRREGRTEGKEEGLTESVAEGLGSVDRVTVEGAVED